MTDDAMKARIDKLPIVTQNYVRDLESRNESQEARIAELEAVLAAGPEGATVFAEYADVQRPLGDDVEVSFFVEGHAFTVSVRDGGLLVDATRDLVIEPIETYQAAIRMKG